MTLALEGCGWDEFDEGAADCLEPTLALIPSLLVCVSVLRTETSSYWLVLDQLLFLLEMFEEDDINAFASTLFEDSNSAESYSAQVTHTFGWYRSSNPILHRSIQELQPRSDAGAVGLLNQ